MPIRRSSTTMGPGYLSKEVYSRASYPREYKPKPIEQQIWKLAEIFCLDSKLALEISRNLPTLPRYAEAWFAIVRWPAIAKTYEEATKKVLMILEQQQSYRDWFVNWYAKEDQCIKERELSAKALAMLASQQGSDILLIPCQLGAKHRGRSAERALTMMNAAEFGLGVFEFSCILLTHPERFSANLNIAQTKTTVYHESRVSSGVLGIDCTGSECFVRNANKIEVPYFHLVDGKLNFGVRRLNVDHPIIGTGSWFLPPLPTKNELASGSKQAAGSFFKTITSITHLTFPGRIL